MRLLTSLLVATLCWFEPLESQSCPAGPTALVLSGGGVKGLGHKGVLRVLDRMGLRPDYVVGTSMGAIIGALYASGYRGSELDSLARNSDLSSIFQSYDLDGSQEFRQLAPLIVWEQGTRGLQIQNAGVSESAVNFLLNNALLRGNLQAMGDFDSLPIPMRAIATDVLTGRPKVFDRGDLALAVRASMAVPLVFEPARIEGRYYFDGGLSENIPTRTARSLGARRLIVSDVTEQAPDSTVAYSALTVGERLLDYLFTQEPDSLASQDVLVRMDLSQHQSLDLSPRTIAAILDESYRMADSALANLTCLTAGTVPAKDLPRRWGKLEVVSDEPGDSAAIGRLLRVVPGDSIAPLLLRRQFVVLGETQWYEALWLHPSGDRDSVGLSIQVQRRPRRVLGLGVAFNSDLGGKVWLGGVDRRLLGQGLAGHALLAVDRYRQQLLLGLKEIGRLGSRELSPTLTGSFMLEDVRTYDSGGREQAPVEVKEALGFLGLERRYLGRWSLSLGLEGRAWREADSSSRALGAVIKLIGTGLDAEPRFVAELALTSEYRWGRLQVRPRIVSGRMVFRPYARVGVGESLPSHLSFPLGGWEGFPGLHLGEKRGDREALGGLLAQLEIAREVYLGAEVAVGRVAAGGALLDGTGWMVGGRLSGEAKTPIGLVGADYGLTEGGRRLLMVRYSRWF